MRKRPHLELGEVYFTPEAWEALDKAGVPYADVKRRQITGDWRDLKPEEKEKNEHNRKQGPKFDLPIVAIWTLRTGVQIEIVTNAERTKTTIRLCSRR